MDGLITLPRKGEALVNGLIRVLTSGRTWNGSGQYAMYSVYQTMGIDFLLQLIEQPVFWEGEISENSMAWCLVYMHKEGKYDDMNRVEVCALAKGFDIKSLAMSKAEQLGYHLFNA